MRQQRATNAKALFVGCYDERLYLAVAVAGEKWHALEMAETTDDVVDLCNEHSVLWPSLKYLHPALDVSQVGLVAEVGQERDDGVAIGILCWSNYHVCCSVLPNVGAKLGPAV